MEYEDIVEVAEAGIGQVNDFLNAGYRLMTVNTSSRGEIIREDKMRMPMARRRIIYSVGRTATVAPFEHPDREGTGK